jgi:Copper transport outer membrane protein, MctB
MGYSSRYHVASLAAVFLALAIGILIGVGFGDNVITGTSKGLEESLKGDLQDARDQVDELGTQLDRERDFGQRAYPALVGDDLKGDRIFLIALGGVPGQLSGDVEAAIDPTEGRLAEVGVVSLPPDTHGLADSLRGTRFARLDKDPDKLEQFGRAAGRQLVRGGPLLRRTRDQLLNRFSGRAQRADDVIVVREPPDGSESDRDREARDALEAGLLDGIHATHVPAVGVERSDADQSSVSLFDSHGLPTVDDLDLISGRVAMVFALLGAGGNFGIKSTADQLLPDLLVPPSGRSGAGR